jgi:hypothetical protein
LIVPYCGNRSEDKHNNDDADYGGALDAQCRFGWLAF